MIKGGKEMGTIDEYKEDYNNARLNIKKGEAIYLPPKQILFVEDGSVDFADLERLGITYVVYRQGSTPPIVVDIK